MAGAMPANTFPPTTATSAALNQPAPKDFALRLLAWYDLHARQLPWRVPPAQSLAGQRPDPYRVWLSEVMLQQTTVATVKPYFQRFIQRWPTIEALAAANIDDIMGEWAGLGYYSRARSLYACATRVASEHFGTFPRTESALRELPGIGPYTAAAIASIAFDQPASVVDGNVERVLARQLALQAPPVDARAQIVEAAAARTPDQRPGDYAQAMMDLGATICTPRNPQCLLCPVRQGCLAHERGLADSLPVKKVKPPKPVRRGVTLLVLSADKSQILVETRPARGLLGGTMGLLTSDWVEAPQALGQAKYDFQDWQDFAAPGLDEALAVLLPPAEALGIARHTFTHFHLVSQVRRVTISADQPQSNRWRWVSLDDAANQLPTAFAKCLKLL